MAVVAGYKGFVTSWGSPNDAILSLFAPMSFSAQISAEQYDSTAFVAGSTSAVVRTRVKGLREWTASIEGYNATPVAGHLGTFTGTNIYATNPKSWEVTINADALETTTFQPSSQWKTFVPGLVNWALTYECYVDSSTALVLPDATAGTTASFTATLSTGNTLGGTVVVTDCAISTEVGGLATVRYSCVGTGHLTTVGSANVLPANSGTMTIPAASSMVLTTYDDASDKTLTGSAFWTSLKVSTAVGSPIRLSAAVRGGGALTAA